MAARNDFNNQAIAAAVTQAHARYGRAPGGANASYIPYLASVPAALAGVAVVTVDGQVFEAGDTRYAFAIESISEVCSLALALEQHGSDEIEKRIGADAGGLSFHSVTTLELHGDRPLGPLVNAGALTMISVIEANDAQDRCAQILAMQCRLAGRRIERSDEVDQSEQSTNYHIRALASFLYADEILYCDPREACEVYARQCSTLINCADLAAMGATLAAGGVNPLTKEHVLTAHNVPHILAEMAMAGLYNSSGNWASTVGLPGKSGMGGGILAVMPGVAAIAGFSPPLDFSGNSVRGQLMVAHVAKAMGWDLYRVPGA
ncbi:glutaminase A [uncultured Thiodictyon sp.]|uniref:glutaminase A n=1 Tax=uncultured Thiodictyon sp. TaxID=1846217 RepID=UPI0025E46809|nr:glutaminase A [uncultured Thiodictyon sp.]